MPLALETMFRSIAPPHIGQSPLPGSEAVTERIWGPSQRAAPMERTAAESTFIFVIRNASLILLLCRSSLGCGRRFGWCCRRAQRRHFEVVEVHFIGCIG